MRFSANSIWIIGKPREILSCLAELQNKYYYVLQAVQNAGS